MSQRQNENAAAADTSRSELAERVWSQHDRIAFGLLLLSLPAALIWLVHPWYDPMNDASIYISTTRSLLAGEGYSHLGMPFMVRPPGFSFLLAPLLASVGANFHAMNLFVAGFGCGTIALLFLWVRPQLGGPLALLVCIAVGLNPTFLRLSNQVMSDVPGTFFIVFALLVARRFERDPSIGKDVLLGLCIGLATYVRVVCILVLPAVLLDRGFRHLRTSPDARSLFQFGVRRCLTLAAVTVMAFAPWIVRNQLAASEPPVDQFLNHSYITGLLHTDKGDPDSPRLSARDWQVRLVTRGGEVATSLATRFEHSTPTTPRLLLALLVFGIYLRWLVATPSAAGFFILFCLGIMGSYFDFQDRLLIPVFVLLIPALSEAIHGWAKHRFGIRVATGVVALLLGAITLLDFSPRHRWEKVEATHKRMLNITETLNRELPQDARLASVIGFHYSMLMNRPVYSLRWSYRHEAGHPGLDAVIDRYQLNTVLLDPTVRRDHDVGVVLAEQYGQAESVAGMRVLRVRD